MTEDMLKDPRITAVGLLFEAYAGLMARFAVQLHEHGLSPVEFDVLMRLARSPCQQLRMTDLAAQTSLSTSGVTRLVDRMERNGLLTRLACPSDRRSLFATMTEAGRQRLHAALPGHLHLIEQWFTDQLTPPALNSLLDGLRQVRDAVNPDATAGSADETCPPPAPSPPPNKS
ncbi:MAG TPA: MarR family transcriptional regulator [Micromonosporaceae bacterium]|nr:MarR family transcriptional regulator [Micromonosporaceae bacterium]